MNYHPNVSRAQLESSGSLDGVWQWHGGVILIVPGDQLNPREEKIERPDDVVAATRQIAHPDAGGAIPDLGHRSMPPLPPQ